MTCLFFLLTFWFACWVFPGSIGVKTLSLLHHDGAGSGDLAVLS